MGLFFSHHVIYSNFSKYNISSDALAYYLSMILFHQLLLAQVVVHYVRCLLSITTVERLEGVCKFRGIVLYMKYSLNIAMWNIGASFLISLIALLGRHEINHIC